MSEAIQESSVEATEVPTNESTIEEVVDETQDSVESEELDASIDDSSEVDNSAETIEELQDNVEDAIAAGATEEQVQDMIREFEIKVNGKTRKKKVDLSDEEQIRRILQREAAGQEAMQRARELEKAYNSGLEELKNDPFRVLQELGLDPDILAEQRIQERIEEMKKTPEQIEFERMQKELAEARKREENLKKQQEEAEFQQLVDQQAESLEREIEDAFVDSNTFLKPNRSVLMKLVNALEWAERQTDEDGQPIGQVKVKDVLPIVEEEYLKELNDLFQDVPDAMFEKYVGKQNLDRYRKAKLNNAKTANSKKVNQLASSNKKLEDSDMKKRDRKTKNMSDFFRNLAKSNKY